MKNNSKNTLKKVASHLREDMETFRKEYDEDKDLLKRIKKRKPNKRLHEKGAYRREFL